MECNKCHFIYKEEDTKKFSCNHIICKTCFYNIIIKDLINSINNSVKSYSIICKCNKGTLIFDLEELKNAELPSNFEEIKTCSLHNNESFQFYDKNNKILLCTKCNENPEYKTHEKIKIDDLKEKIKEKASEIKYTTYEQMQNYMKSYFEKFVQNSKEYYEEEIAKMEFLIEKIKSMEKDIKEQMEKQIEKEKILFDLIDILYKKNYENLKILNDGESDDNKSRYGYRFYKQLSKVKFNFGEFDTEHQEEIIPEIDKIIKDIDENLSKKKFRINIKYPYFELIKSFSKINDYKQGSIISCIAANRITNEISVGYRDYSIDIFRPQGSNYESSQKITDHKGEVSTLLYINNYLISGSKDKTIRIWESQSDSNNSYILKQTISFEKEIKKLNIYIKESQIGFLVTGDESSFRLFLKKSDDAINKMEVEEKDKKEEADLPNDKEKEKEKEKEEKASEEIFEVKQVLNEHDNEVNEAIQIKSNNDIISGSKDMTVIVWKDNNDSLGYESGQIISAGNEVQSVCPFGNKGFAFAINGSYEIKIYEFSNDEIQYENICVLNEAFCHSKPINQIILLKDNRLASCSYDSYIKIISFNSLTKELREDQELEDENSVNSIAETGNGKLIAGGHYKHLIVYKRS